MMIKTLGSEAAFGSAAYSGLTKREYFAGQALVAILANKKEFTGFKKVDGTSFDTTDIAVLYADNLIFALNNQTKKENTNG